MLLHSKLIHPTINEVLGRAGHGSRVLIADGNYPASTTLGPNATQVNLNLSPGLVTCTQVLEALVTAMPIEAAAVMAYAKTGPYGLTEDPPIWSEFKQIFQDAKVDVDLELIERFKFYDVGAEPNVALTIATGEQRIYANLLLTIGVRLP